jgi:excinuclease ABC subunit A
MQNAEIELTNVRVNNLKDLSLTIPHGQWLSICGLSGSGKSSLAFDTLYAEGQRRYMEALSVKTRQFLRQLDRPDADHVSGLPPAIAIRAPKGKPGLRTTLGSATEIEPMLRMAFAKVAKAFCPSCGKPVNRDSAESVLGWFGELSPGRKAVIAWPVPEAADVQEVASASIRDGFVRGISDGSFIELNSLTPEAKSVEIVVDRIKTGDTVHSRIIESLETAFYCGEGNALVLVEDESGSTTIDNRPWNRRAFSGDARCANCNIQLPVPEPRLFSVSNSKAACETCGGTGLIKETLEACYACAGTRFQIASLAWRLSGKNFADVCDMTVSETSAFLKLLDLSAAEQQTIAPILERIETRLGFLMETGLGHVTLDRPLRTLSSGEAQRVLLTTVLGTTLTNMLFVLDEPSIGLHPHNIQQLTQSISKLHDRGNTVVVVDHAPEVIQSANRIVEIGPGAGANGGEVVFDGTVDEIRKDEESLTGQYLSRRRGFSTGQENRRKSHRFMKLIGASGNNLKNINVEFPLGILCAVTGVSGAGKSSLVMNTLFGAVSQKFDTDIAGTLPFEDIYGADWISEIVLVDDSPIGKSSRSNPVTYVKAFSEIRNCFAETADAQRRNFDPGKFSFNVAGGRCEKCRGDGQLSLNMQFMADLWVTCDQCNGTRFREDVLECRYRDQNIAQVLSMTVREAFPFFRGHPAVQKKLKALVDVGLDYVQLGQPANTLSSGESQRLKLAHYLNTAKNRRVLFLMDQPTTGLHPHDTIRLLDCFNSLISVGHSMIVVEHNLGFIKHADWIIDLGPGAAEQGGRVVAAGTPEDVAGIEASMTGQYLKQLLT